MERYPARDLLKVNEPVRRALAARYPRILVDEFQDTDPLQAEIIWRLAGEGDVALPWHDASLPAARLYVAETCGPCAELRRWFKRQG
ncbi:MAG TPA: UvrD-helicase domain-containing protein, partial [Candidatus Acidoferrum sp.]|nr:UvrD-helicase domain-containing protein [Candidatus Acidoferrum sp.]